jgi:hypothetical protein
MRIPKLNIRKRVGRKSGSPLHDDPNLVKFLALLRTIDDYNSFETWRGAFLERLGYFLVDESIERSKEAYKRGLHLKVDELVRNISIIARHVNDGNLSSTHVTDKARNSLDNGMKSCEEISICLKVFSPFTVAEEENIGFSKYNTAAILVETCFREYELLNMCRDILQVLRENFINPVAEPQHLAAFNNYEQGIISFKSIILEDVGLLPVLKKQRQLKAPNPPKTLIVEIRRRVLREALISKSLDAKKAPQGKKNGHDIVESNPTVMKTKFDKGKVDRMPKDRVLSHNSEVPFGNDNSSIGDVIDQDSSLVNIKREKISASAANRNHLENSAVNEVKKIKRTRKKISSKSPPKRRLTTNNPQRFVKQSVDEINTSQFPSRFHRTSKSPTRDLSEQNWEMNRPSSRRKGIKNTVYSEHDKCDDELSSGVQILSSRKKSTPLNKTSEAKNNTALILNREEKGFDNPDSHTRKQASNRAGYGKSDSPFIFLKLADPSKILAEDKMSNLSDCRKKSSKMKAERARKGKKLLKSPVRARSIVSKRKGLEALRKKEFSVDFLSVVHNEVKGPPLMKGEDSQFENHGENATVKGSVSKPSKCKKPPRNISHKKSLNQNRDYTGDTESELLFEKELTSNRIESRGLSSNGKSAKKSVEKSWNLLSRGNEMHKTKNIDHSKALKQKKKTNSWMTDDYKKIVHRKAYSSHAKKVLSKLNIKGPFPGLISDNIFLQEASKPTESNSFGSKFENLQAKEGDKLSSNILPSLLDNCTNLNQDEDGSETFPKAALIEESDRSHTNNRKFEWRLPLSGYLGKKSALISFDGDNLVKEGADIKSVDFDEKNQGPSFYENFIKPLTIIEYDSTGKNEGESSYKAEERWEAEKDVFEDSVCSSRSMSTNSSIAAAIKFCSDESIIELLRLNEIGKQKDATKEMPSQENPETKPSSIMVTSSNDTIVEGMTEIAESVKKRKMWGLRTEEIELWKEIDFFKNNEIYDLYNQTKEILSVEEETIRMEDEVAKLKIVLEDNQHVLDCIGLDFEDDGDSELDEFTTLKFRGDGDIYCTVLDDKVEERDIVTNEISSRSKEDAELEMAEKMYQFEAREDFNDVDENECVNETTYEGTFKSIEYEELEMAEKMFQRESSKASNEILSTSHLGETSKGNESLNLVTSNQAQKNGRRHASRHQYGYESSFAKANARENKGITPGRGVMVYDPSERLSRYQTPRNARVPLFIA